MSEARLDCLTVFVGTPHWASTLESNSPSLVVEGDAERAEQLRSSFQAHHKITIIHAVASEQDGKQVLWHSYNDARFNGADSVDDLQTKFPNIKPLHSTTITTRSLQDILNNFEPKPSKLRLALYQGNVLSILSGLGPWLEQLESVQFGNTARDVESSPGIEEFLQEQGFKPIESTKHNWERDQLATLTNQNIELRKTANILEQSNSKLQVERSRLQAEIARLQLECNEQAKQRATLEDNLNRINHELDEILALIDQGQEELDVNP
jgi:hypothetical protein